MTGLPRLRSELSMVSGPPEPDGAPTWTIHDPVRNIFFRLGWVERAMLAHWGKGKAPDIAAAVAADTGAAIDTAAVKDFAAFLSANQLLHGNPPPPPASGLLTGLLHSYLFFRIPLGSPDRWMAAVAPRLMPLLLSPVFGLAMAALAVWGLVHTASRWEEFTATLPPVATAGGLAMYGAMLALSAIIHEFGHAFAARHFGCRVGTMGIAIMVMVPTLYTDTSDIWRLRRSGQRMAVGLAGIAAEMLLAVPALALWSLLPEGAARSAATTLATTALATTLAVNLSPFMRFDGYFILSDLLGIANLQQRAFALFRWRLRRLLFGMDHGKPEILPPRLDAALTAWAVAVIPYRAMLYFAIAVLVYHSTFKLAGIALFAVEVGWFLVRPCWQEMRQWWRLRSAMRPRRLVLSGALAMMAAASVLLPWQSSLELPAVLEAGRHTRLFPALAGRVEETHVVLGTRVAQGQVLLRLEAPDLRHKLAGMDLQLAAAQWRVDHLPARAGDMDRIRVEEEALASLRRERLDIQAQLARLELRAPHDGVIAETDPAIVVGSWLAETMAVAELIDPSNCRVAAFVEEGDWARLAVGAKAKFYPDGVDLRPSEIVLVRKDAVAARDLDDPYFAADQGGGVEIRHTEDKAVPARAMFGLRFEAAGEAGCIMRRRGVVVVESLAESMAHGLLRRVMALLREESGF